ncbi:hypothetical protein NQ176_g4578 [Zarea fungicola]|uniref:Uncharacterized protein n=1 Tax=Zarea fungicola TaxID=93591 RepID=A0ACC1NF78_9HYPO|nr:hypothetical protein NQ176_g4578 [Lecanicillium fungicola]
MFLNQSLLVLVTIATGVMADWGHVSCTPGTFPGPCGGGGCASQPVHRIQLTINGQPCWGPFKTGGCGLLGNGVHDGTSKFECGRNVDVWKTADGCWNLNIDGKHAYCCVSGGCDFTF